MATIIVDANVVAKMFLSESDAEQSIDLFRACLEQKIQVVAPDLVKYEVAQTAARHKFPLIKVMDVFDQSISKLVDQQTPSDGAWLMAEEIYKAGHVKSGYPSLYDSIYHAMAIEKGGVFITADKRHYAKTKQFGHIGLLSDWESVLEDL